MRPRRTRGDDDAAERRRRHHAGDHHRRVGVRRPDALLLPRPGRNAERLAPESDDHALSGRPCHGVGDVLRLRHQRERRRPGRVTDGHRRRGGWRRMGGHQHGDVDRDVEGAGLGGMEPDLARVQVRHLWRAAKPERLRRRCRVLPIRRRDERHRPGGLVSPRGVFAEGHESGLPRQGAHSRR